MWRVRRVSQAETVSQFSSSFFYAYASVQLLVGALLDTLGPVKSKIRVPLFAARTLNATGQYRVTPSLW